MQKGPRNIQTFAKGDRVEILNLSTQVRGHVIAEPFEGDNNLGQSVLLVPVEVPYGQGFKAHGVEVTRVCLMDIHLKKLEGQ